MHSLSLCHQYELFLAAQFTMMLTHETLERSNCGQSISPQDSEDETLCSSTPPRCSILERPLERRATITLANLIRVAIPLSSLPSFDFQDNRKCTSYYIAIVINL